MDVEQVCEEHDFQFIAIDPAIAESTVDNAIGLWIMLGHGLLDPDGVGTLYLSMDNGWLDLMVGPPGTVAAGVAGRVGNDCHVLLRNPYDWRVLAHEIGHCLCYGHTEPRRRPHLMDPVVRPGPFVVTGLKR